MTDHDTAYRMWPECTIHPEPDGVDDPRYECVGNSGCLGFPLADWGAWIASPHENHQGAYVLCEGCTTFVDEQQAWEAEHEYGSGVDDWSGIIALHEPPKTYCRECSDEEGDWVQHIEPEDEE